VYSGDNQIAGFGNTVTKLHVARCKRGNFLTYGKSVTLMKDRALCIY